MKHLESRIIGLVWLLRDAPWLYFMYGLTGGTLATLGLVILRGRK